MIAYENDKTDLLDLLDSQMTVIDIDLAWLQAVGDFDARLADLELATGAPLEQSAPARNGGETVKTRSYQIALAAAVAVCVLLAAALAYVLHASRITRPSQDLRRTRWWRAGRTMASQATAATAPTAAGCRTCAGAVQFSPQRLQEIGVTIGDVRTEGCQRQPERSRQRGH